MAEVNIFSDSVLVCSSVMITIGYHAYLCHSLRRRPRLTTMGINSIKRRAWLLQLNQGDDKKGMLTVQSLRNTFMATILTAVVTITVSLCLAALISNAFNAATHLSSSNGIVASSPVLGLQSQQPKIIGLKYGSASVFLMASFLSSSIGLASLVDANFLINAIGDLYTHGGGSFESYIYTQTIMERGFKLAAVGNRLLCVTVPLLLWIFGPVFALISSLLLVGALHQLDFPAPLVS